MQFFEDKHFAEGSDVEDYIKSEEIYRSSWGCTPKDSPAEQRDKGRPAENTRAKSAPVGNLSPQGLSSQGLHPREYFTAGHLANPNMGGCRCPCQGCQKKAPWYPRGQLEAYEAAPGQDPQPLSPSNMLILAFLILLVSIITLRTSYSMHREIKKIKKSLRQNKEILPA